MSVKAKTQSNLTIEQIENGMADVHASPKRNGSLEMLVVRPKTGERLVLDTVEASVEGGVHGDNWAERKGSRNDDGSINTAAQVTLMNSRFVQLIAGSRERWSLAGDQLFVDFDLSEANIPPGSRVQVGDVIFEVSAKPHLGCSQFRGWYGADALKAVNQPKGRAQKLRGINAWVVQGGTLRVGDNVTVVD